MEQLPPVIGKPSQLRPLLRKRITAGRDLLDRIAAARDVVDSAPPKRNDKKLHLDEFLQIQRESDVLDPLQSAWINWSRSNRRALLRYFGATVTAEDFIAYVAAVTSHPAFTNRFIEDLRTPGIRVPLTADPALWAEAVELGRRVLWLHTRGERCADAKAGRPRSAPDATDPECRPLVQRAIPGSKSSYPDELTYDAKTQVLSIGGGQIGPVPQEVIDYEVSGMNVLRRWFGYRRATRPQSRGEQSALDDVRPQTWPSAYTTDLIELLRVLALVVELEPNQAELLDKIMDADRITVADLTEAGVLPVSDAARKPFAKSRAKKDSDPQLGLALD